MLSRQNIVPSNCNNLQRDFSLLANMLKKESQQVLGCQLHSFLTQMNKNSQYNYYLSKSMNAYKNRKNKRKSDIIKTNHLRSQQAELQDIKKLLIGEQKVNKNNTTLHYRSFSSSKHNNRDYSSLRSTSSSNLDL